MKYLSHYRLFESFSKEELNHLKQLTFVKVGEGFSRDPTSGKTNYGKHAIIGKKYQMIRKSGSNNRWLLVDGSEDLTKWENSRAYLIKDMQVYNGISNMLYDLGHKLVNKDDETFKPPIIIDGKIKKKFNSVLKTAEEVEKWENHAKGPHILIGSKDGKQWGVFPQTKEALEFIKKKLGGSEEEREEVTLLMKKAFKEKYKDTEDDYLLNFIMVPKSIRTRNASAAQIKKALAPSSSSTAPNSSSTAPNSSSTTSSTSTTANTKTIPIHQRTVKLGSKGEDVKVLQKRLGTVEVDGKFGPSTKAAVIVFQKANELDPDGIAGPKTWAAILKLQESTVYSFYEFIKRSNGLKDSLNYFFNGKK